MGTKELEENAIRQKCGDTDERLRLNGKTRLRMIKIFRRLKATDRWVIKTASEKPISLATHTGCGLEMYSYWHWGGETIIDKKERGLIAPF